MSVGSLIRFPGYPAEAMIVSSQLSYEHVDILDLVLAAMVGYGAMANWGSLRALADEGNEKALDKLADLAEERGDADVLNELLDESCDRAGEHLTRRA